jgi:hypothetical protein
MAPSLVFARNELCSSPPILVLRFDSGVEEHRENPALVAQPRVIYLFCH